MSKLSNALMGLVGTLGAAIFIAACVMSGAYTSAPGLAWVFILGVTILAALPVGAAPIMAFVGGASGTKEPKAKKKKKGKKSKDAVATEDVDDFADDDDFCEADESFVGSDDSMAEDYDSFASSDADAFDGGEASESSVAGMLDDDAPGGVGGDDPFDISDSFESDVKDIDLALDGSESFDDQFELSPDSGIDPTSGIDFDLEDDEEKA